MNNLKIKLAFAFCLINFLAFGQYQNKGFVSNFGGEISNSKHFSAISSIGEAGAFAPTKSTSFENKSGFAPLINETTLNISVLEKNALIDLFNATNGAKWTNKEGWNKTTTDLSKWHGIKLDENSRIVEINLADNNLVGKIPNSLNALTALKKINVANNQIKATYDLSSLPNIDSVILSNNRLNFDALVGLSNLKKVKYNNQKPFYLLINDKIAPKISKYKVDSLLKLSAKNAGENTNNKYVWKIGDKSIENINKLTHSFKINRENMGIYSVAVTNEKIPNLTLTSNPSTLLGFSTVKVNIKNKEEQALTKDTKVFLIRKLKGRRGYDTTAVATLNGETFEFKDIILYDYLVNSQSDTSKYLPTYYGNKVLWRNAVQLSVNGDTTISISQKKKLKRGDGTGKVRGFIDENFVDESGRTLAKRRAKRRKCGLRKRRTGGRNSEEDIWELFAYGETNDEGEFEYGFIPKGTYQFFVEFPGIPMDESSFVQFEVGEKGTADNELVLSAVITEEGIAVEKVLGIANNKYGIEVFPNPTISIITIKSKPFPNESLIYEMFDNKGVRIDENMIDTSKMDVNLSNFQSGIYFLHIFNKEKTKKIGIFKIIKSK